MKQEKITDKTTLFSMEPTDAYGWGDCQLNPFKLETGFKSADGVVFVFYDLFAVRPDLIQVAAHEERAAARFDARERQRLGAG